MGISRWFLLGAVTPVLLLAPVRKSSAMIHIGGDIWCVETWVDGNFSGLGNCYSFSSGSPGGGGGGGDPNPTPGGGGGSNTGGSNSGGTTTPPPALDLTDRPISSKLTCAIRNYSSGDVRLGSKRIVNVNAWAFYKVLPNGLNEFAYSATNVPPGPGWNYAGGRTQYGDTVARIYKMAHVANNVNFQGSRPGASPNQLSGAVTSFEMQLYNAVHEAAHLTRDSNEAEAFWYGIDAVLAWRRDGGRDCVPPDENQPNK